MKFSIAVIALCAFQSSLVLGRTPDEVIEDFRPLILELHNILGKETYKLDNEVGQSYINGYQKAIGSLNESTNIALNWTQRFIEQRVNEVVTETNMTSHEDQIQHCFAQKDTGEAKLILTAMAGREVCLQFADIDIDNFKTILNDYKNKQYPMHTALEQSVHTCKRNSGNGFEMVSCLVDHIIVQVAPQVGQTLNDMKTNMAGMSSIVAERINAAYSCFNFVTGKVDGSMNDVIEGFLECCVEASQNN